MTSASWLLMKLMLDHWYTLGKKAHKTPMDYTCMVKLNFEILH